MNRYDDYEPLFSNAPVTCRCSLQALQTLCGAIGFGFNVNGEKLVKISLVQKPGHVLHLFYSP